MPQPLTDREREILAFESQRWRFAGSKETAIRDRFDVSGTRYYQELLGVIAKPAALEVDPVLVHRLLRQRDERRASRSRRSA